MFEFVTNWISRLAFGSASNRQADDPGQTDSTTPEAGCESGVSPPAADYTRLMERLDNWSSFLSNSCQEVEHDFLQMGEHLQSIYNRATALTRDARQSTEILSDDSGGTVLARIGAMAQGALRDLDQEQHAIHTSLDQVRNMGDHIHNLHGLSGELRKMAKILRIVGININIESSRSSDGSAVFGALAQEIRDLAKTVSEVAGDLFTDTGQMHTELVGMYDEVQIKLDQFLELFRAAQQNVSKATAQVQALIEQSMNALQHVGDCAGTISESIGQVVMNIQIHDNVSQRVDHICQAFNDAKEICRQLGESGTDSTENLEKRFALYSIIGIQSAQVQTIVSEIEDARQKSTAAFAEIGRAVQVISKNMEVMTSEERHQTLVCNQEDTSIESLKKALLEIDRLINRGTRSAEELNAITGDATRSVERFSELMAQVREVNFAIRLKALNAILKSNRIGRNGMSIVVLVEEMKDLAVRSDEFVNQMEQISRQILDTGHMLQTGSGPQGDKLPTGAKDTEADFKTAMDQFAAICDQFKQKAYHTIADGRMLAREIVQSETRLAFLVPFAEDFRSRIAQLDEIIRELAPLVNAGSENQHFHQEDLLARYTMQQERDIQYMALNQTGEPVAYSGDQNGNELWDVSDCSQKQADDRVAVPAGRQESEFGDNVDLF